jgi:hypothetical protein
MGESKGQYTSEKQKKLLNTVYGALVGNRIAEFEHMLKLTSDELVPKLKLLRFNEKIFLGGTNLIGIII